MYDIFTEEQMQKISEIAELPASSAAGLKTVKTSSVDREWERGLSDILFRITGFSHFFGNLAFQCKFHWSVDIPTAGAIVKDGKFHVFLNPVFLYDFLEKGSHQAFVIVHEVYHIFFDHTERRTESGYDPMMWNIACDHYIHHKLNEMINNGSGSAATRNSVELIPQDVFPICFEDKYKGMTEDEIYKTFEQQAKEDKNGSGDGSEDDSDGSGGQGQGGGSPSQNGSQNGSGQRVLDECPESQTEGDGNNSTNQTAIARAVNCAVASAMQTHKEMGDIEADIIREFAEINQPKVDWKSQLQDKMESVRDQQITYSHFNRRSSEEVIFPSKTGEYINVFFGVDSSGSMSNDELGEALSELQGLVNQLDSWDITVASCDTRCHVISELSSDEDDELNSDVIKIRGNGGTELSPMVGYAQEMDEDEQPQIIIILTDGYIPIEPIKEVYEDEIPILFVVTGDGQDLSEHFDCIKLEV